MNTALYISGTAIREISESVNGTAHNVANINTPYFTALSYNYETGTFGTGVDSYLSSPYVSDLYQEDSMLFTMNGNYNVTSDKATQEIIMEEERVYAEIAAVEAQRALVESGIAKDFYESEQLAMSMNNVALEREFTSLIQDETALEANATFFQAADVMYESLLRMLPEQEYSWTPSEPYEPPTSFVVADIMIGHVIELET